MNLASVRGMPAILPIESNKRRQVEDRLKEVIRRFNYVELRPPLLERTELFARSIGASTQLVEKEMYTFLDRNDVSVTVRPEATAGMVRACIEHNLLRQGEQRLWYLGPMFRYERPQSGRMRQFDQLDVEVIGAAAPSFDAELIWMTSCFWQALNLPSPPVLHINALGNAKTRADYNTALSAFLSRHKSRLDEDSLRRLDKNPLRILDSKVPQTRSLVKTAPHLSDYWDEETRSHLEKTCELLDQLGIMYKRNPLLVRGLDYYDKLVFEWMSDDLGAQNTLCAGGRYDNLIEQLGGGSVAASGFALGMERLMLLLEKTASIAEETQPDLFLICSTGSSDALKIRHRLMDAFPNLRVECPFSTSSLKSQLRKANRKKARFALIVGEKEISQDHFLLRDMEASRQETMNWKTLCQALANHFPS